MLNSHMPSTFDLIDKVKRVASLVNLTPHTEPQRAYNFEVTVAGAQGNSNMMFFVKGLSVPAITRDPINIPYLDSNIQYSGRISSAQTITITFWDDQSSHVLAYIHDWMDLTGNESTQEAMNKVNRGLQYVRTIYVDLKDTTDLLRTGRFEFVNAFPTEIGEISLSYDDSSVVEVPVTFAYDQRKFTNDIGFEFNWREIIA